MKGAAQTAQEQQKKLKERKAAALTGKGLGCKRVNEDGLSAEDEDFCQIFAGPTEMFGNGVQSYIRAYKISVVNKPRRGNPKEKTYSACKVAAHDRLTNPNFLARINEIFEGGGLNETFVDKQLEKVITQDAEFAPKVQAIKEFNRLKKRVTDRVEHVFANDDRTDTDVESRIQKLENFFTKKSNKK